MIAEADRQGKGGVDVTGGDQINPGFGEDERRRLAALHLAGHGRTDHLDQRMMAGQHAERPDRGLAQCLGRLSRLGQVNDALGPVGSRLPAARGVNVRGLLNQNYEMFLL